MIARAPRSDDYIPVKRPAAVRRPAAAFQDEKRFRRCARPVQDAVRLFREEALPEAGREVPLAAIPDVPVPEIPEAAHPDTSAPEAAIPDVPAPEVPEAAIPETPAPEVPEEAAPVPEAVPEVPEGPVREVPEEEDAFARRLAERRDELKWLYCELYREDQASYDAFEAMLRRSWEERSRALRRQDAAREAAPDWYRSRKALGMQLYVQAFAGTLKGVQERLPYLQECGVNILHLMPLLESPKGRSDGGYAVSSFRRVQPELGTMEDLEELAAACRSLGISLCLDFVMNHTSEDHEWARKARAGEPGYRERYFFYDSWDIPRAFEQTVPQVFPSTAPGSFTQLEDGQIVMTSFYPYQWDLNYANPAVFRDMTENLLYLANRGIDILRLDAIPYIWKELGTSCRNLPQVHTLTRMIRLACEIVCPGVLLLGEVVMEPARVAPYFGTPDSPECHMLYNVTTMCTTWHTLATGDAGLLAHQLEALFALPHQFLFLNYLRCHDDIGWGLDYPWLWQHRGAGEVPHKRYLNDWFTGRWPGSPARGELYNDAPALGDARLCGTTASLSGLESAVRSADPEATDRAVDTVLTLHAWMLSQSGIPVLYSGDEVGRFNDWSYHDDPDKAADSRYIHRGNFQWDLARERTVPGTYQEQLFRGLRRLETIRAGEPCFDADADCQVLESCSNRVLAFARRAQGRELVCLYNFSAENATASILAGRGCTDLWSGEHRDRPRGIPLPPRSFAWLLLD